MNVEKIVKLVKYKKITPTPAKRQKLDNALIDELIPIKKAIAFVREVIVIEDPDSFKPSLILSYTERFGSVLSIDDDNTNISSTPMPISKNGKRE